MFQRLTATLIVIFWLCMTGLLVVREMYPQFTRLNDVPTAYVARLIFQHEQSTDLEIYDGTRDIGNLHFQPRHNKDTGDLLLEFHGALAVDLPGGIHQKLSWVGTMDMDPNFRVTRVAAKVGYLQNSGQIDLLIEPQKNIARFSSRSGNDVVSEEKLTLDEAGFTGLMARAGLGTVQLTQLKAAGSQFTTPEFNAQTSSLQLNGESVSTFYFSMKIDGQLIIEAHLSQLGQVLRGQVPLLGYKFAPQNLTP